MNCQTCTHWKLLTSAGQELPMAKFGFGECALGRPWITYPPQHACPKHKPVPADVQAARVAWLGKLQK